MTELLRLLEEEVAAVKAAFEEEVAVQEENDAIKQDACLAPAGETSEMLLRQEAALDRSIDRTMRILLTMRQDMHAYLGGRSNRPRREPEDGAAEPSPGRGLDARTGKSGGGKRRAKPRNRQTKRESLLKTKDRQSKGSPESKRRHGHPCRAESRPRWPYQQLRGQDAHTGGRDGRAAS